MPTPYSLMPAGAREFAEDVYNKLVAAKIGITIAAGDDVTEGNTTDAAVISDTTGTVSGKLRGLVKWAFERMPAALGQAAMSASLPVVVASNQSAIAVTPAATEAHLGEVGGNLLAVSFEYTRPADTNAYTAKDVIADSTSAPTLMSWAGAARVTGGTGYITKARLVTDQKTNTSTFRLWLYSSAPTAINDNAPYTLLYADNSKRIGSLDLPALSTEDATNSTAASALNITDKLPYSCAATTLYGILETPSGFTPASGQKFWIELTFDRN